MNESIDFAFVFGLLNHGNCSFFEGFTWQAAFQYATVGAVFAFVTRIAHPILAVAH